MEIITLQRGTISPGELHHFLASNKLHYGPSRRCNFLPRLHSVLMITVTDFLWIFSLSFFLGSFVSALNNVVTRFGKDLTPILGSTSPGFVVAWLSLFGTIAFTQIAYEWSSDSFDLKEQAKVVLGSCVRYDSYYNRDSEIWVRYNQNNGLDKESLSRLLEEAYIILSEGELNALFKEIDHDGNGVLCKDEIEAYLADEKHRQIAILRMCLRSPYFWSNFIWFLGSIACLGPVYTTDSLTVTWCYRVSFVLMPLSQEIHSAFASKKCNSQCSYYQFSNSLGVWVILSALLVVLSWYTSQWSASIV